MEDIHLNLFYKAKRLKRKQNSPAPVYLSLLSMLLCTFCLAGTSWAWFTANQTLGVTTIESAVWEVVETLAFEIVPVPQTMELDDGSGLPPVRFDVETNEILMPGGGMVLYAQADTPYYISVETEGNSATGYVLVSTCDGDFYTFEDSIVFTALLSETSPISVRAHWGAVPEDAVWFAPGALLGDGVMPTCSCDVRCYVPDESCPICRKYDAACDGPEPPPACTCLVQCTDVIDAACEACNNGWGCSAAPVAELPVAPEIPAEPETPVEPEVPVEPETPVEPEVPAEPETPVEPEVPAEPETPVEPEVPVEPEAPVESETPVEPEVPVESETPVEPEVPAESESPVEPEIPVESETPVEPEMPDVSEPSVEPDTTEPAPSDAVVADPEEV